MSKKEMNREPANEYHVGITYVPAVGDEFGVTDRVISCELDNLAAKHRRGSVCRGNFPGIKADEGFSFFSLEDAIGFMKDTIDKEYVVRELLIRSDEYN